MNRREINRRGRALANDLTQTVALAVVDLEPLEQLVVADRLERTVRALAQGYYRDAARQHTWAEIGEALGMTPQGAQQRYARRTRPKP